MSNQGEVHPSTIVEDGAKIGKNTTIGPFCYIGPNVTIGDNCKIGPSVHIYGATTIGNENQIFSHCSLGAPPQDFSAKGEETRLIIGNKNIFREYISVHRGTLKQHGETVIGSENYFMAYVHVAHDVTIGNNVLIINSVNLAGHVTINDKAVIGGASNVARWVRVGKGAYIGGASAVDRDVLPYTASYGNRLLLKGINIVGLRKTGFERKHISEALEFYKLLETSIMSPKVFISHEENLAEFKDNPIVFEIVKFIEESELGLASFMN